MISKNLDSYTLIGRKKRCGCVVALSGIDPRISDSFFHDFEDCTEIEIDILPTEEAKAAFAICGGHAQETNEE